MKKMIFGLLILLTGCSTETNSIVYEELTKNLAKNVAKKTYIGGNVGNLELLEYNGHEYMIYHGGNGVAMLHLESCKCKNTNNE